MLESLASAARDGVAVIGKRELAQRASLSERYVDEVLTELVAGELVQVLRVGGGRQGRAYVSNAYALTPRGDELADARQWRRRPAWSPHLDALIRARTKSACAVRMVYAALLSRRSRDGEAWPGVDSPGGLVAACAGMSRSTVLAAHAVLVELGLVGVRYTRPGETFPNGVPARAGSSVRTVALPPAPPAPSRAYGGPLTPAPSGPLPPHRTDSRGAHGGPEVNSERVRERESAGARTRTRESAAVLEAIDAAHWNRRLRDSFDDESHELAGAAVERFGLDAVLRGVTRGVAASRYFADESQPGRRLPKILLRVDKLAELVALANVAGGGRVSDARTPPRDELTPEQRAAEAARIRALNPFARRTA